MELSQIPGNNPDLHISFAHYSWNSSSKIEIALFTKNIFPYNLRLQLACQINIRDMFSTLTYLGVGWGMEITPFISESIGKELTPYTE